MYDKTCKIESFTIILYIWNFDEDAPPYSAYFLNANHFMINVCCKKKGKERKKRKRKEKNLYIFCYILKILANVF